MISDPAQIAIHPMDESVYGIFDLAGSVSEPVLSGIPQEYLRMVTIRGANWDATDPRDFHAASRARMIPENQLRYVGFRLVAEAE